jgi:hypothetical protein
MTKSNDKEVKQEGVTALVYFRYNLGIHLYEHSKVESIRAKLEKINNQYKVIFAALGFIEEINELIVTLNPNYFLYYISKNYSVSEHKPFSDFLTSYTGSLRKLNLRGLSADEGMLAAILKLLELTPACKNSLKILDIAGNQFSPLILQYIIDTFPDVVIQGLDEWSYYNYSWRMEINQARGFPPEARSKMREKIAIEVQEISKPKAILEQRNEQLLLKAEAKEKKEQPPVKTNGDILDLLPSKIKLYNPEIEINIDDKFTISSYSRAFFSSLFGCFKMSFREYIKDLYNQAPDKALSILQALREGNIHKLTAALQERRLLKGFSNATVGTQLVDAMLRTFNERSSVDQQQPSMHANRK